MATPSIELIQALRSTAARLLVTDDYQWGHMGACNCGHLAQTVTHLDRGAIHDAAMQRRGDWEEQANAYCPDSGFMIDDIITALVKLGLTTQDVGYLEKLTGPAVLAELPEGERHLSRNVREDVVRYLEAWAGLLERQLPRREAVRAA